MVQGGCGKCCIAAACTAPDNTPSTPTGMLECCCPKEPELFNPAPSLAAEAHCTACRCDCCHIVRCAALAYYKCVNREPFTLWQQLASGSSPNCTTAAAMPTNQTGQSVSAAQCQQCLLPLSC
jgi:hypothetical protein